MIRIMTVRLRQAHDQRMDHRFFHCKEVSMEHTWIVVADSSRARILSTQSRVQAPTDVDALTHPEGRMKAQELNSDRPGRTYDSHGEGRHGMEPPDVHHHEQEVFAKEIAEHLEKARHAGKFAKLALVAPPAFLGVLRQKLNGQLGKLVSHTVQKNLLEQDNETIRAQLFD
jgi:protein required for attachment to host cells